MVFGRPPRHLCDAHHQVVLTASACVQRLSEAVVALRAGDSADADITWDAVAGGVCAPAVAAVAAHERLEGVCAHAADAGRLTQLCQQSLLYRGGITRLPRFDSVPWCAAQPEAPSHEVPLPPAPRLAPPLPTPRPCTATPRSHPSRLASAVGVVGTPSAAPRGVWRRCLPGAVR